MNTVAVAGLAIGSAALALTLVAFIFTRQRHDFCEYVSTLWFRTRRWLGGPRRVKAGPVSLYLPPDMFPGAELSPYSIGDLVFPLVVLVGGDGQSVYRHPDGI